PRAPAWKPRRQQWRSRKRKAASPSRQPPDGSNGDCPVEEESATCWSRLRTMSSWCWLLAKVTGDGRRSVYQDHRTGMSVLMAAAASGSADTVRCLLDNGAPWNAVDRQYHCAGEYATWNGHQAVVDLLLNHAAASELLLGALLSGRARSGRHRAAARVHAPAAHLLWRRRPATRRRRLRRHDGLGAAAHGATRQLHLAARPGLRVLNVGFGMGIVDTELQKLGPASHTIVEAHPDVLARMRDQGWPDKPGVRIVSGRWQDVVADLGPFDGVFFDTRLRSCPTAAAPASACGAPSGRFPVKVDDAKLWQGVRDRYWHFDTYYLPEVCRPEEEDSQSAAARWMPVP
uniref:ANK_REP_REGION domain-containing protein n=1 Tax=Macrostomum lignano TaxID=282301 RepID=A0A1I8FQ51_9PLAT